MKTYPLPRLILALAVASLFFGGIVWGAAAQQPVVRAILFYSPSCGHCHYVIEEVFPPLFEQYGDQLQIAGVDVTTQEGGGLYDAALRSLNAPDSVGGVPLLIVGETILVGSIQIPEQFPGLIETHLANGGLGWPPIPGLSDLLPAEETAPEPTAAPEVVAPEVAAQPEAAVEAAAPAAEADPVEAPAAPAPFEQIGPSSETESVLDRFGRDRVANSLAIIVLLGLIGGLVYAIMRIARVWGTDASRLVAGFNGWRAWAVPALCLVGLGVAAYLAFVETTHTEAVCGPVGDCNAVQQSQYATLFGFLHVGVLGVIGYTAMLLAWAGQQWGSGRLREWSYLALVGMALGGVAFSIYLTFLEPFVIGATCAWCLTSAVIMLLILLLVTPRPLPAKAAAMRRARA